MQIDFRSFVHSFFSVPFFPVYSFFEHIARQTESYTTHKHIFIGISSLISDYGFWIQMERAFRLKGISTLYFYFMQLTDANVRRYTFKFT